MQSLFVPRILCDRDRSGQLKQDDAELKSEQVLQE